MANILDIRRRIRSVTNTRQITKAMKVVSAAKLRRAQDRALAARPYAEMLTNVLKSLVSRAEILDPETGEPRHPLVAQREERRVLLIIVTGHIDLSVGSVAGFVGAVNTNILKAAMHFLESKAGQNVEIEAIGRKGRDFMRRRFPKAQARVRTGEREASSASSVTIVGEQVGVLNKLDYSVAAEIAERVIERYRNGDIDSVYLLFNEFKSVMVQRLVVEQILPVEHIGWTVVSQAAEMTKEEKAKARKAAVAAGVGLRAADTSEIDAEAARFATAKVDYIYEQSPTELFNSLLPGLEYFTPNYSALAGWIAIYGVAFTIILLLFGLILFEDRDLA